MLPGLKYVEETLQFLDFYWRAYDTKFTIIYSPHNNNKVFQSAYAQIIMYMGPKSPIYLEIFKHSCIKIWNKLNNNSFIAPLTDAWPSFLRWQALEPDVDYLPTKQCYIIINTDRKLNTAFRYEANE